MLSDKDIKPDNELIFSIIKDRKVLWIEMMKHMNENYPLASGDWHYYNDGKQWLFKMEQKKKTIFWAGLVENTFRITFYFGDKALPFIEESSLPDQIKNDFKTGKKYGAIRAVTINMNDLSDVAKVQKLLAIKGKMK